MTTPDIVVEIAFDSGYTTPAASRTWTDVSAYVELEQTIGIRRGREDEHAEVSPSQMSLVLDNSDGRFTPGRASSPYYPDVKVGRPIRVKVTPDGGTESVRFVGYVDEWPVTWDGTDAYASVTVTATSRTARLGLSSPLRSVIEQETLASEPVAYYLLNEGDGATEAADIVNPDAPTLAVVGNGAAVVFGNATGPGTDDHAAAEFNGGKYLESPQPLAGTVEAVSCFMLMDAAPATGVTLVAAFAPPTTMTLGVNTSGELTLQHGNRLATGPVVTDGETHHVAIRGGSATSSKLYVDGALAATSNITAAGVSGAVLIVGQEAEATLAHVTFWASEPTEAQVAAISAAGLTGFADDTPADRLERYAAYADVPTAEQSFATGTAPIAHVDTTGKGPVELMQTVATTDGGVLFDGRDGTLTYLSRDVRYQAATEITLLADSQEIEADYSPKLDRSALLNDLTVSNQGPTVQVRALDTTSRGEYGTFAESLELATDDEAEIHGAAWWRVNTRAEPSLRTPSLTVDLLPLDTTRQDALLALDLSSRVTVTGLPSQAAETDVDYFVEGYTETIGYESYVFTLNVSDAAPWLSTFVFDDPVRGTFDEGNTFAY